MPVTGLLSSDPKNLKFKWKTFGIVHTGFVIFGLLICNILAIYRLLISVNASSFSIARPLVFLTSNLYAVSCFFLLARKFPCIMQKWLEVEMELPRVKHKSHQYIMTRKIRLASIVFLLTSIVEHLFSMSKNIYFSHYCRTVPSANEAYYKRAAPYIFNFFDYSTPRGVLTSFFLITSTFIW